MHWLTVSEDSVHKNACFVHRLAVSEDSVHKNACFVYGLAVSEDSVHKNACFVHGLAVPEAEAGIETVASVKNPSKIITGDVKQG